MTQASADITMQLGQVAAPIDRRLVFMAIGTMGLGLQLLVLRMLATGTTLALQTSMVLAVETALLHNFAWHERWTWADRKAGTPGAWLQRLARFHVTSGVVSIAGNVLLTSVFVSGAGLHYLVANVLAVGACTLLNFLAADRLVFRSPQAPTARARRRKWIGVFAACLALTGPAAEAAPPPQSDMEGAWRAYVQATELRIARELASPDGFLCRTSRPRPRAPAARSRAATSAW